uniref:UDP-glucuronosyltransferase 2B14 n=1 Tax=Ceratitis capitata TaxID=7213 RepID=W8C8A0_CERCA
MSPFWERYKFWLLDTLVEWTLYWNEIFHDMMGSYDIKHFSCAGKTLAESRKQIALIFTNHHFSQSLIRPNVPAIVEIGGIHISDYKVNLLPDLLRHINTAENGFIYINLGSSYNCSDVPTGLTNILYDYFTTNRMFVVWRWAYCIEPPTSPFIYYQTWLDQAALLSNPDLLAFITHGSQNSLTEGIHYNVKMLAITTTPEQMANAEYLAAQGAMLHLRDVEVVSPQMLHFSLYNLIHDPTFKQVAATLSEKYRDRPLTPRQTVLYWANYVLRYRGAVHLRSPAVDMHYFQRIGLDFVLVSLALLLAFYIAIAQVRKLFKPPPFTPKNQYDYIMAAPADMYKIDETKNYQIRPTSSDDTAGEETAGEDKAREAVEEDVAGPVMQPNRPRQRKNIQKNKRK